MTEAASSFLRQSDSLPRIRRTDPFPIRTLRLKFKERSRAQDPANLPAIRGDDFNARDMLKNNERKCKIVGFVSQCGQSRAVAKNQRDIFKIAEIGPGLLDHLVADINTRHLAKDPSKHPGHASDPATDFKNTQI